MRQSGSPTATLRIDTTGLPALGDPLAPVEMVVFEDPRCEACRIFHVQVLPALKERFIDTEKVRCSFVMLSFLEHSEPLALASLGVFKTHPEQFFPFIHALYTLTSIDYEDSDIEKMLSIKLPGITPEQLQEALSDAQLKRILESNELLAWKVMPMAIATPTVYIDGREVEKTSLELVSAAIELALAERSQP